MTPEPQITVPVWLSIPIETRRRIAERYKLTKSGSTHVVVANGKGEVTADGYTHEDLRKIPIGGKDPHEIMRIVLEELDRPTIHEEPLAFEEKPPVATRFCLHCESRGAKHMKNCKRNELVQA